MDPLTVNLASEIRQTEEFLQSTKNVDGRQRALFFLSRFRRMLGIARLLRDGDVRAFRADLGLSARARLEALRAFRRSGGPPGRYEAAGNYGPLLDAFVAGEDGVADEIASLSVDAWVQDEEYEDDFRYALLLHALVRARGRADATHGPLLDAYEGALGGVETGRVAACKGLILRDPASLDQGLRSLEREWADLFAEEEKGLIGKPARYQTEKFVFVEGLALLGLADAAGLDTAPEYRFMPGVARWRA